jgi:5-(carboxyamino)imidazole ribonucleotide synthase
VDKVNEIPYTTLHLYGKSPTKVDRKMGHITATGETVSEARERAEQARKELNI